MRPYEMMVLLTTDLKDDDLTSQLETIEGWVKNNDGEIAEIKHWGRRRMAYEIKDQRDAYYVLYQLNMPASAPSEVERNLRLNESVLRYLITRTDD
jgi:small subunit ribosomal protein S6